MFTPCSRPEKCCSLEHHPKLTVHRRSWTRTHTHISSSGISRGRGPSQNQPDHRITVGNRDSPLMRVEPAGSEHVPQITHHLVDTPLCTIPPAWHLSLCENLLCMDRTACYPCGRSKQKPRLHTSHTPPTSAKRNSGRLGGIRACTNDQSNAHTTNLHASTRAP